MAKLVWDQTGDRLFEAGVKNVVLYPYDSSQNDYGDGVAWNGVVSINENPSGAEPNPIWADNIKYANLLSAEEYAATIEAYTYPDEFAECDGSASLTTGVTISMQKRKTFGLCYRTEIGNDTDDLSHGYKLHLVYGCLASPAQREYSTLNDSPEPISMSWDISTTPVPVTIGEGSSAVTYNPTAHLEIDSTKVSVAGMAAIEALLYGSNSTSASLPLPATVASTISSAT